MNSLPPGQNELGDAVDLFCHAADFELARKISKELRSQY